MDWFTPGGGSIKHCQPIWQSGNLASALVILYYFSVGPLGSYLNTHVNYFTVVSSVTCLICLIKSSAFSDAPCASFFLILSTAVRWEKQGFQYFMIGKRNCHVTDLFKDIMHNKDHKLASLLPPKNTNCRYLWSIRTFNTPVCKTDRFKKSFMISHSLKM